MALSPQTKGGQFYLRFSLVTGIWLEINLRHVEPLLWITSIDGVHRFTGDKTLLCTLLSCMLGSDGGSKGRKKLKCFPPELRNGEEIARFLQKGISKTDHRAKHKRMSITSTKTQRVWEEHIVNPRQRSWEEGQAKLSSCNKVSEWRAVKTTVGQSRLLVLLFVAYIIHVCWVTWSCLTLWPYGM